MVSDCAGDTVRIEITLPSREALSDFSFGVEKLSHIYVSMESLWSSLARKSKSVTKSVIKSDFVDVQCRAGNIPRHLESAVAMIIFESGGRAGYCPGTLLNDTDEGSFVPYS